MGNGYSVVSKIEYVAVRSFLIESPLFDPGEKKKIALSGVFHSDEIGINIFIQNIQTFRIKSTRNNLS